MAAWLYLHYGTNYAIIFYTGLIILSVTCILWWHWSLSAMVTMLAIMKDTDDHFATVTEQLELLRLKLDDKPRLKLVKPVDEPK